MIDNGMEADLEAIAQNIDEAEVVSIFFPVLRKALLIDSRSTPDVGPMVRVVPMARDSSERLRSLRRLRPQFPSPCSLSLIPWNLRVGSLEHLGVWDRVLERIAACGAGEAECAAATGLLRGLRADERREIELAIRGEDYHTLWQRSEVGAD